MSFDILGPVSGVVTIVSFVLSFFPPAPKTPKNSSMRLGVGMNAAAEGNVPRVLVYNSDHANIGGYNPNKRFCSSNGWGGTTCYDRYEKVGRGQFVDLEIFQTSNQQPQYIMLEQVDNDGICLAYATHTWPDGNKFAWIGDWAETCGRHWYHSDVVIDNKSGKKTKCAWLDKDKTDGQGAVALHLYMPAFAPNFGAGKGKPANWYCGHKGLLHFLDKADEQLYMWRTHARSLQGRRSVDAGPEANQTAGGSVPVPTARVRSEAMATELIVSHDPAQSAADLCNSPYSFGPDFVSVPEQLACDMDSHTLWPLCSANVTGSCFDLDKKAPRIPSDSPQERELVSVYQKVTEWK
ncbi:hypothetical protein RB597_007648 [Gaeumannomyces tritici]